MRDAKTEAPATSQTQQKKKDKASEKPAAEKPAEKPVEKPAPPPVPEIPKPRMLPCAICNQMEPTGDNNHLSCKECRLTVHRKCYGIFDNRQQGKWTCDMCVNDKNPQVSIVSELGTSRIRVAY